MFESTMLSKTMRLHRTRRKGFTLIEVLVVVAIIALLIAILLPSLVAARGTAKRVACMAQMREMYTGTINYVQANRDWLPSAEVIGNWYSRYAPEMKSDPRALPEYYGLPAVLRKNKCIPGKTNLWLCPDAKSFWLQFKNSYVNAITPTLSEKTLTNILLSRRSYSARGKQWWVWENYMYKPYTPTGANVPSRSLRQGSDPDNPEGGFDVKGYTIDAKERKALVPHNYQGSVWSTTRMINALRIDGVVGQNKPSLND